jgi:hypothetical protein
MLLCSFCSFPFRRLPPPDDPKDEDAHSVEARQNRLEGGPTHMGALEKAEKNGHPVMLQEDHGQQPKATRPAPERSS